MRELYRNIGKLLSANIFAQILGLAVYPILTRMYAPEDFGLLNLFLSIGGILALLSTSEYQSAILLPADEKEAAGISRVALCLAAGWVLLIALTIPFAGPIAAVFKAPALGRYYWMLVPYVAALGAWAVYNAWLTRRQAFGRMSAYQVNQSVAGTLTKLLFGWKGWLRGGLIWSSVFAPLIALGCAVGRSREAFRAMWQKADQTLRELAHDYRRFPLFTMPRSLVNNLSGNIPALLLTPYFGLHQMGFLAMAMTLAFRPVTMITSSIYQVLFEYVAQSVREKRRVWSDLSRRWWRLAAIVMPTMGVLTAIMPWLVRILLGNGWDETATLIRYMMPWLTCVFLVSPLAFISEVFGRQKLFLGIEIMYLLLRVAAMVTGIYLHSFAWAIILMSAAGTLVLLFQLGLYVFFLRRYELSLTQTSK